MQHPGRVEATVMNTLRPTCELSEFPRGIWKSRAARLARGGGGVVPPCRLERRAQRASLPVPGRAGLQPAPPSGLCRLRAIRAASAWTRWRAGCRTSPMPTSPTPAWRAWRSGWSGARGSGSTASRGRRALRADHVLQRARPDVGRAADRHRPLRRRTRPTAAGADVEAVSLWVHLDADDGRPWPLTEAETRTTQRGGAPAGDGAAASPAAGPLDGGEPWIFRATSATSPATSTTPRTGSRWRRSCWRRLTRTARRGDRVPVAGPTGAEADRAQREHRWIVGDDSELHASLRLGSTGGD